MSIAPLLRVTGLHRRYGRLQAVADISFEVGRGEVVGLLGVNGAGKSTTLAMLAGVLAPDAGSVEIDGRPLADAGSSARRRIGYLPERPPLAPELTVDEYLSFCARLHGCDGADAVESVVRRCGLEAVRRRLTGNLSKGYQQRVGIAQALLHEPALVILDEPSSGLDPVQNREVRELVRDIGREHAVILSTHALAEVQACCTRVLMLATGRLVLDTPLSGIDADGRHVRTRIVLRHPPGDDALLAMEGVRSLHHDDDGGIVLVHDVDDAFPERLADRAVRAGWGLQALAPAATSLEQRFLQIACTPRGAEDAP